MVPSANGGGVVPPLDRALRQVKTVFESDHERVRRVSVLMQSVAKMRGADKLLRRIADVRDRETLTDHLAEIRYARVFERLRFDVEFEPTVEGSFKKPDLKISRDGKDALVEVTRIRERNEWEPGCPGPPHVDPTNVLGGLPKGELPKYGNINRDTITAGSKIDGEISQVKNQRGVVAIWNDHLELEEIETRCAVAAKIQYSRPRDVLFVLYGSKQIGNQQFWCFPLGELGQPFQTWKIDIESARWRSWADE
jgi:hypothetical protein